jgi:hypothetical protein
MWDGPVWAMAGLSAEMIASCTGPDGMTTIAPAVDPYANDGFG